MDLFLALCQALGLGLAIGIGGPLSALFVAAMARFEAGLDPTGTDWDFLASDGFLTALLAANVVAFAIARRGLPARLPLAALAAAVGAIAAAASLAERGEPAAIGLVVGAIAAAGTALLAQDVLAGAQRRTGATPGDRGDRAGGTEGGVLALILAAAGIAAAALVLFAEPVALLLLAALAALAAARRRRAGEKYEGLRILR